MYQIGVDIGGTNIKIGLLDSSMFIIEKQSIPFPHTTGEDAAKQIAEAIFNLVDRHQITVQELESIGIIVPGSIDPLGGTVINAYNLGFHQVPLRNFMQSYFQNTDVFLANDADGAALAELHKGAFQGCQTAVLLTIGTGLGGGVILGGRIFRGGRNNGTEPGHFILLDNGVPCTCGNHGCVEAYCSATALARFGRNAMEKSPTSLLCQLSGNRPDAVDAKLVIDCAKQGDKPAMDAFDIFIEHLSSCCASFFNILDAEVIAIGGGVSGAGDFLFVPLAERTHRKCFYRNHGQVVPAQMGNDAGIIGAAMLGRQGK